MGNPHLHVLKCSPPTVGWRQKTHSTKNNLSLSLEEHTKTLIILIMFIFEINFKNSRKKTVLPGEKLRNDRKVWWTSHSTHKKNNIWMA